MPRKKNRHRFASGGVRATTAMIFGRNCKLRWPIGTKQKHKIENRITKPKTETQNRKQNHKTQNGNPKPKTESQNAQQKHKTENRNTK